MRLGVLTTSYPRRPGDAAGSFVETFAQAAAAMGHEVSVVAMGRPEAGGAPNVIRPSGADDVAGGGHAAVAVPVRWVEGGAALFADGGAPDALARGGRAWVHAAHAQVALVAHAVAASRSWDAVVSNWLLPCGLAGQLAARGRPHLAIAHSSDVHLAVAKRLAAPLSLALCAAPATRLAFTSDRLLRKWIAAAGPTGPAVRRRALVSPMGVPSALRPPTPREREAARAALGLKPTTTAILCLARLVPIKGVDRLIDAAALLGGAPDAVVLLAGDGPLAHALRARAHARGAHNVRFLGQIEGDAKLRALHAADVLCLPSRPLPDGREDGAPLAILEGLACGLPIVASCTGGIPELVDDGTTSLLVPVTGDAAYDTPRDAAPATAADSGADIVALAAALRRLCDPAVRAPLAAAAALHGRRHDATHVTAALLAHMLRAR
jgi:hypothetical protein